MREIVSGISARCFLNKTWVYTFLYGMGFRHFDGRSQTEDA